MIILHKQTRERIEKAIEDAPHALLFSGPVGAGKLYAAKHTAHAILQLPSIDSLAGYPYFQIFSPTGTTISIDQIRSLQDFSRLKTPGNHRIRRIAIIENAHLMTIEAQNALLKVLEEPPADTVIILTAVNTLGLKDTIYSRVRQIPIHPVDKNQLIEFYKNEDEDQIEKAYRLSKGLPGLFNAILKSKDHQLFSAINMTKEVLGAPRYQRLTYVDAISKQKEQLPLFLQACKLICSALLNNAIEKNDIKKSRKILSTLKAVHYAEAALPRNPNSKLLVTDLLLHI